MSQDMGVMLVQKEHQNDRALPGRLFLLPTMSPRSAPEGLPIAKQ